MPSELIKRLKGGLSKTVSWRKLYLRRTLKKEGCFSGKGWKWQRVRVTAKDCSRKEKQHMGRSGDSRTLEIRTVLNLFVVSFYLNIYISFWHHQVSLKQHYP